MGKIYATDRDGSEHELEGRERASFMEILRYAGLSVEALCSGCCQCATCHVYVEEKWFDKIPNAEEAEIDMIDMAIEPKKNSRLSCQIIMTEELDGLVVTTPEKQS